MPTTGKAHGLTDHEKALRERLGPEDWMVVKAGFLTSYVHGRSDTLIQLERRVDAIWDDHPWRPECSEDQCRDCLTAWALREVLAEVEQSALPSVRSIV